MELLDNIKINMSAFHHLLDGIVNANVGNHTQTVINFVDKFQKKKFPKIE
jgi:hypothetical protein